MIGFAFVSQKDFSLRVEEVIREVKAGPHMLLRVSVAGPHFPHRDAAPFVRIVGEGGAAEALMTEVSTDQREMRGYFPTDVKVSGRVEFGYASQVLGSLPIRRPKIVTLDTAKVDPGVHRVTLRDPGAFKVGR